MKLPELFRVRTEDLKDAPTWFTESFIPLYNQFTERIYLGLNKNITNSENIDVQFITINTRRVNGVNNINVNTPYQFPVTINHTPVGVTVMQCLKLNTGNHEPLVGQVGVDWTYSNGAITIYEIYNMEVDPLATEERFDLTLKIE